MLFVQNEVLVSQDREFTEGPCLLSMPLFLHTQQTSTASSTEKIMMWIKVNVGDNKERKYKQNSTT